MAGFVWCRWKTGVCGYVDKKKAQALAVDGTLRIISARELQDLKGRQLTPSAPEAGYKTRDMMPKRKPGRPRKDTQDNTGA